MKKSKLSFILIISIFASILLFPSVAGLTVSDSQVCKSWTAEKQPIPVNEFHSGDTVYLYFKAQDSISSQSGVSSKIDFRLTNPNGEIVNNYAVREFTGSEINVINGGTSSTIETSFLKVLEVSSDTEFGTWAISGYSGNSQLFSQNFVVSKSQSATTQPTAQSQPYVDTHYGFSIVPPYNWRDPIVDNYESSAVSFYDWIFTGSMRVIVNETKLDLANYVTEFKQNITKSLSNANLLWLSDRVRSIDGKECQELTYSYVSDLNPNAGDTGIAKIKDVIFVQNQKAYLIKFETRAYYERFLSEAVENSIASFHFTENVNQTKPSDNGGLLTNLAIVLALVLISGGIIGALVIKRKSIFHRAPKRIEPVKPITAISTAAPSEKGSVEQSLRPKEALNQPSTERDVCKIGFNEIGQVLSIEVPQGQWSIKQSGGNTYYSQNAKSLLRASEILKKVAYIPPQTYYVVRTPDGALGRDKVGFYSEAPIKSKNITLELTSHKSEPVELISFKDFDDSSHQSILSTVAYLKQAGEYAKLVLLMKCGRCGYESPVETQPGTNEKDCYCCGTKNKGERGEINVFLNGKMVTI
jgi:hypothetical protein